MLLRVVFSLVCYAAIFCFSMNAQYAITHNPTDNFGNTLLNYLQARYLSFGTNQPFLYRTFPGSKQLSLGYNAESYDSAVQKYERQYHIQSHEDLSEFLRLIRDPSTQPTLFILDYIPENFLTNNPLHMDHNFFFNMPWHNNEVCKYLQKSIQNNNHSTHHFDPTYLNVALHIPKQYNPVNVLNCPPIAYYKNQIARLQSWNLKIPIKIMLFSQVEKNSITPLLNDLHSNNIPYDLWEISESHECEFLFALQQCNVLIATQSSLSIALARLGAFDALFIPVHYQEGATENWIDCVHLITQNSSWFPYPLDVIVRDYQ